MKTCAHGKDVSKDGCITCFECEAEDMPEVEPEAPGAEGPTCHHGTYYEQVECEQCADEEECSESDMPMICEHNIEEDDCSECQAKFDRMAEAHRDQQDWNHHHPDE